MKPVSTFAKRHPGINGVATSTSRYLDLCVTWDAVPKPQRLSLAAQALNSFDQVFVLCSEFRHFTRRHDGADIPNPGRVAHLAGRSLVPVHRCLLARKVIVHDPTIPTREHPLLVWLAILKTPEVLQNLGLVTIG